jgi:hypothetical protein
VNGIYQLTYIINAQAGNMHLPLELLQLVTTFPFNVILVMVIALIVGIVYSYTRRPAHSSKPFNGVDIEEMSQSLQGSDALSQAAEIEKEIPQLFEDYADGVVKLYSWFYRFTQRRFVGIPDNMTPREFKDAVLLKSPSTVASTLDYLVAIFEIANYSSQKLTKEMLDKSLEAVRLMKELIEDGSSHLSDHELTHDESPSTLRTDEIHVRALDNPAP